MSSPPTAPSDDHDHDFSVQHPSQTSSRIRLTPLEPSLPSIPAPLSLTTPSIQEESSASQTQGPSPIVPPANSGLLLPRFRLGPEDHREGDDDDDEEEEVTPQSQGRTLHLDNSLEDVIITNGTTPSPTQGTSQTAASRQSHEQVSTTADGTRESSISNPLPSTPRPPHTSPSLSNHQPSSEPSTPTTPTQRNGDRTFNLSTNRGLLIHPLSPFQGFTAAAMLLQGLAQARSQSQPQAPSQAQAQDANTVSPRDARPTLHLRTSQPTQQPHPSNPQQDPSHQNQAEEGERTPLLLYNQPIHHPRPPTRRPRASPPPVPRHTHYNQRNRRISPHEYPRRSPIRDMPVRHAVDVLELLYPSHSREGTGLSDTETAEFRWSRFEVMLLGGFVVVMFGIVSGFILLLRWLWSLVGLEERGGGGGV